MGTHRSQAVPSVAEEADIIAMDTTAKISFMTYPQSTAEDLAATVVTRDARRP